MILVTGAAGFIGSHLCKSLLQQGETVLGVDNFSLYYSTELKKKRLEFLFTHERFDFTEIELADAEQVKVLFREFHFTHVYHLAAQAGVRLPPSELDLYIISNISAFTNVLNSSIEFEVPNFLYASSSSVYGNLETELFSESSSKNIPSSYYGISKLFNEHAARVLSKGSKTRTRGLRFFTVYGPMGRPDMAYFRIVTALLTNTEFHLYGDGNVKRDFTYIADVVTSVTLLGNQLNCLPRQYSDVVNVGGGRPHSMNELITTAESLMNEKLRVVRLAANLSDATHTQADTTYIQELTGFKPATSISSGLNSFIEWAKSDGVRENLVDWVTSSR